MKIKMQLIGILAIFCLLVEGGSVLVSASKAKLNNTVKTINNIKTNHNSAQVSQLPDLVVSQIKWLEIKKTSKNNQTCYMPYPQYVVANKGKTSAPEFVITSYYKLSNGKGWVSMGSQMPTSLSPGKTFTGSGAFPNKWPTWCPGSDVKIIFKVVADPTGVVKELNENNNFATKVFPDFSSLKKMKLK